MPVKALFIIPTDAHNYNHRNFKTIKIPTIAPTCFGSRRNHHQGAISYLAKTTIMACRHDIDHVINDEHNRTIIVILANYEIAP